ncbi:MAG: hypothetical protein Q8P41_11300 [Pseudomonadota bacterium]|nr:hypothetical protein [Pseudomonadota bacterium]
MDLAALLRDPAPPLATVRDALDALDPAAQYAAIQACERAELNRLYELAADAPPIDAAHFVLDRGPLEPVAHDGWNSLPLPRAARRFQKVFARPEPGGPPRLYGYNEGDARKWIGPGYFQVVPTAGDPVFEARGAWVVDYFRVPDGPVPAGWPKVVPNWWGPQALVYAGTRDFMRRVSRHVSVGKPWGRFGALPFCFALVRRD